MSIFDLIWTKSPSHTLGESQDYYWWQTPEQLMNYIYHEHSWSFSEPFLQVWVSSSVAGGGKLCQLWVCNLTAHLSEAGYITPDRTLACHQVTPVQISSGTPKPFLDDICSSKYSNITGKFPFYIYIIISCHVLWKRFNLYWLVVSYLGIPPPHVFNIAISSSRDSQCAVCHLCGLDVKLKQFFWGTSSRLSVGPGLGCWKPMTNIFIPPAQSTENSSQRGWLLRYLKHLDFPPCAF